MDALTRLQTELVDPVEPAPSLRQPIVVAVEPTQPPSVALGVAASLAHQADLPLRIVSVRPPALGRVACRYHLTQRARDAQRAGVAVVEQMTLEGNPVNAIAEHLSGMGCSLLCLASHGRSALGEAVRGSVSEALLRRVEVPVLLVGPVVADPPGSIDQVVACIDGLELAPKVLGVAREAARALDADLTLLQVVDDSVTPDGVVESGYLHRLVASLAPDRAAWEVLHGRVSPAAAILDHLSLRDRVLLVTGTEGRYGLEGMVHPSVALQLVRRSPNPVLVVPPGP